MSSCASGGTARPTDPFPSRPARTRRAGARNVARWVCLVVSLAAPLSIAAADSPSSESVPLWPVPIDTIQVRARRLSRAQQLARESAFAARIEVAAERRAGEGLADLLDRATGIRVTRLGGPGMPATVSIRGAGPGEVEVFLDRTPLRSASRGIVDLNAIDLGQIASIEVYRSAPPSDLGGQISSAAVRLITRGEDRLGATLRVMSGSQGTRELTEVLTVRSARQAFHAAISRFSTGGDFRYYNDNGTAYEPADDAWTSWTNGAQVRQTLLGRWRARLFEDAHGELSTQLLSRDQGIPGTCQLPTQQVRFRTQSALHRCELDAGSLLHPLRANLYAFAEMASHAYRDPLRELSLFGTPKEIDQHFDRQGGGLHLQWLRLDSGRMLGAHSVEALAEVGAERLLQESPRERPQEDRRTRRSQMLSLGDHWDALDGRLRLSAFYRWDRSTDNYTGFNPYRPFVAQPEHVSTAAGPRLGLRVTLPHGPLLKANYAHQARFPTFAELFGIEGTVRANGELQPETGWRADLGWLWQTKRGPLGTDLSVEQAFYTSRLEQMIVFVQVSDHETRPFNLDRVRIDGCELSLAVDHLPGLREVNILPALEERARDWLHSRPAIAAADSLRAAARTDAGFTLRFTWQDARDEGVSPIYHGKQLPYHPALETQAGLNLTQGRWTFAYTTRHRSTVYWARSNLEMFRTPAQWQHDLSARCRLHERLILGLRIENLWDQGIEDIRGYPLPGRSWYGELEWRWTPSST
ncbi:MAG: TonB-dependent receptor [Candidatus Eisenbacteria bacterium]